MSLVVNACIAFAPFLLIYVLFTVTPHITFLIFLQEALRIDVCDTAPDEIPFLII
jgi:hypothetical protein